MLLYYCTIGFSGLVMKVVDSHLLSLGLITAITQMSCWCHEGDPA